MGDGILPTYRKKKCSIFFSPDEKIRLVLDDIKIEIPQGMEVHDDTVGLNLPLTVMGRDALRHVKVPMFIDVPRKIGIGDQGSVECSVVHRLVAKYCPAVSVTSTTLSEKIDYAYKTSDRQMKVCFFVGLRQ